MRTETPLYSSLLNRLPIWHAECQCSRANLQHVRIVSVYEPFLCGGGKGGGPRRQQTAIVIAHSEDQLNYNLKSLCSLYRDCIK